MPSTFLTSADANLLAMLLAEARDQGLIPNLHRERIAVHSLMEAFEAGMTDEEGLRRALRSRLQPNAVPSKDAKATSRKAPWNHAAPIARRRTDHHPD